MDLPVDLPQCVCVCVCMNLFIHCGLPVTSVNQLIVYRHFLSQLILCRFV